MRNTILALCAVAVIGGSLLIGWSGTMGSGWRYNQTTSSYLTVKVKIGKTGTFATYYIVRPAMDQFWDSGGCTFTGGLACPPGMNQTFHWSLFFPAGLGSKYSPMKGGKYKFSSKKDTSSMVESLFREDLAQGLGWLDYGYRGNTTMKSLYKAGAVTPLGGTVEVTSVSASGSTKPGDTDADGKFKFSFTGSILDGPNAGEPIKGTIQLGFKDAYLDTE
jgi:hypothetical protein